MKKRKLRDDFSNKVKQQLAKRVGFLCSNPNCEHSTIGPSLSTTEAINMGVAAHITAASPGGARYDPSLTPAQRKSYENGIYLCQYCADLVDKDEVTYPVELLRSWKTVAEHRAGMEVHRLPQAVNEKTAQRGHREKGFRNHLPVADGLNTVKRIRDEFHATLRANQFGNLDSSDGVLAIVIVPAMPLDTPIDLSATGSLLRRKLEPVCASGNDYWSDSRFFGTIAMSRDGKVFDVTQFTDQGVICAANRRILVEDSRDYQQNKDDEEPIRSIYLSKIERVSVEAITSYFSLLKEFNISTSWYVDISLINLRPSVVLSTDIWLYGSGKKIFKDKDIIIPDPTRIEVLLSEQEKVAQTLRPVFNFHWRAFGYEGSPYFNASGKWRSITD
ncbi:MAG: hypothetical protein ACLQPD_18405 [Desulfomonilaceae bacterium]